MQWFNILYLVVVILGFLVCLYKAATAETTIVAGLWLVASPLVAIAAPIGILFAGIAAVMWLLFYAVPNGFTSGRHGLRGAPG